MAKAKIETVQEKVVTHVETQVVRLDLSKDEAEALRSLLFTKVWGAGPNRKLMDAIEQALQEAGVDEGVEFWGEIWTEPHKF